MPEIRRDDAGDPLFFVVEPRYLVAERGDPEHPKHWDGFHYPGSLTGVRCREIKLAQPTMLLADPGVYVTSHIALERFDAWLKGPDRDGKRPEERGATLHQLTRKTRWATWVQCWFGHVTLRAGRDDGELLASFERHVRQHERYQELPHEHWPPDGICLMGAEDRWRWNLCECDGCRRGPMQVIAH